MAPTVLLIVPGSYCPSLAYYDFRDFVKQTNPHLQDVIVHDLPSASSGPPLPPPTLYDDGAFFAERIIELADRGFEIILLAHSYGGFVAREAVKGLSRKERTQQNRPGGVIQVIYVSALIPTPGQTVGDACAGIVFDIILPYKEGSADYWRHDLAGSAASLFSDLPQREGIRWAARLTVQSAVTFNNPSTELSQLDYAIPSTYVVCTQDKTLPPVHQRRWIEVLKELSGSSAVQVIEIDTGHCPNASDPERLAKVVSSVLMA